jgi:hypothetical protein
MTDFIDLIAPKQPHLPDPEPAQVLCAYTYNEIKAFRLFSQPYIVRANYDTVQKAIEDGIMKREDKKYREWLAWVVKNL